MKVSKKLLLFNIPILKQGQISKLSEALMAEAVAVPKKRYNEFLGSLAGIPGMEKPGPAYNGPELEGEMMVFFGFDEEELDEFLEKYRDAGIPNVALKALMTPYNMLWTPRKLFEELSEEHKSLKKR